MSTRKLKIYNSPICQGFSKLKTSPPISIEDIEVDKKIESVFELIDKLPTDLQSKLYSDIISLNPSNASNRNLPLISNEFAETYSYTRRLSKIKSKSPEKNLSKQITYVSAVIGDLPLKKINQYSPVKETLKNIFAFNRFPNDVLNEATNMFTWDTLEKCREEYGGTDKKFESKKKEWIEMWDFYASNPEVDLGEPIKYDRLKSDQTKIKKFKKEIKAFDHGKDMDKVENYLKLNENSTYGEYIKSVRELPLSAKAIIGL
jgi:hypothetical protein